MLLFLLLSSLVRPEHFHAPLHLLLPWICTCNGTLESSCSTGGPHSTTTTGDDPSETSPETFFRGNFPNRPPPPYPTILVPQCRGKPLFVRFPLPTPHEEFPGEIPRGAPRPSSTRQRRHAASTTSQEQQRRRSEASCRACDRAGLLRTHPRSAPRRTCGARVRRRCAIGMDVAVGFASWRASTWTWD